MSETAQQTQPLASLRARLTGAIDYAGLRLRVDAECATGRAHDGTVRAPDHPAGPAW